MNDVSLRRLKYFAWHLIATAAIVGALFALVFMVWYPAPLHNQLGAVRVAWISAGVLFLVGPAFTLAFCKPGKKTLVLDAVVIVLLQLGVLSLALSTLGQGRVAWIVFTVDRFEVVRAGEIDTRRLDEAAAQYSRPAWTGPQWVAAIQPDDPEVRSQVLFEAVLHGVDLQHHPEFYGPVDDALPSILAASKPLADLYALNDHAAADHLLSRHPDADRWLPLAHGDRFFTVLFSSTTFRPVMINLYPYQ